MVSGGRGSSSNNRACTIATAKGTGTSKHRLPIKRTTILTKSRSVYTSGPASSYVRPALSGSVSTRAMASATSST